MSPADPAITTPARKEPSDTIKTTPKENRLSTEKIKPKEENPESPEKPTSPVPEFETPTPLNGTLSVDAPTVTPGETNKKSSEKNMESKEMDTVRPTPEVPKEVTLLSSPSPTSSTTVTTQRTVEAAYTGLSSSGPGIDRAKTGRHSESPVLQATEATEGRTGYNSSSTPIGYDRTTSPQMDELLASTLPVGLNSAVEHKGLVGESTSEKFDAATTSRTDRTTLKGADSTAHNNDEEELKKSSQVPSTADYSENVVSSTTTTPLRSDDGTPKMNDSSAQEELKTRGPVKEPNGLSPTSSNSIQSDGLSSPPVVSSSEKTSPEIRTDTTKSTYKATTLSGTEGTTDVEIPSNSTQRSTTTDSPTTTFRNLETTGVTQSAPTYTPPPMSTPLAPPSTSTPNDREGGQLLVDQESFDIRTDTNFAKQHIEKDRIFRNGAGKSLRVVVRPHCNVTLYLLRKAVGREPDDVLYSNTDSDSDKSFNIILSNQQKGVGNATAHCT